MYKLNKIGNTIRCKGKTETHSVNLVNLKILAKEGLRQI